MKKKFKRIPRFNNEDEERDFWAKADTSLYFNWLKPIKMDLSKLQLSTKSTKKEKYKQPNL